ncbi:hypothetical protein HNP84_004933 [Thermocatellispora tengchongensis]|uniref:DUF4034 domain-containing protein n=2 Tax=Thermocatellispora tengchongensis TaxID=1073253 RepID=A0A840PDF9_9ACTN|nr:hypothetical protein [Thermocatellispora tengchongensis]MBB5135197.1 hypothetical protein [Thermocatellispora tengchongensis]
MGVIEVDKLRARGARMIVDRPWADVMLDDAVTAVRHGSFAAAVPVLAATRGDPELRALRVEALSRAAMGASTAIERLIQQDRSNPDLWLWLGRTLVEQAWQLKPDVRARAVQAHRLQSFQQAMDSARRPLLTAASLIPADPVPWEAMMWVALGLDRPRSDKDSVWFEAARRYPTLFPANVARLTTLSPAWGGTAQEMLEFARTQAARAPESDPLPALVPLAHFENAAAGRSPMSRGAWFPEEALREIVAAAGRWWQRGRHPRGIEAHNIFGAAFYTADLRRPARGHLARTGGRGSRLPWSHLGDPAHQYQRACARLNVPVPA